MLVGALIITFIVWDWNLKIVWLSHWKILLWKSWLDPFLCNSPNHYSLQTYHRNKTTKDDEWKQTSYFVSSFVNWSWFAWYLGASPGEVVDQIQEVECHQEEGKHKEESEDHARGSDHYIHRDWRTFVGRLESERIMIVALKVLTKTYSWMIYGKNSKQVFGWSLQGRQYAYHPTVNLYVKERN